MNNINKLNCYFSYSAGWVEGGVAALPLRFRNIFPLKSARISAGITIFAFLICAWTVTTTAWAADGGYIYDAAGEVTISSGKNSTHTAVKNDLVPPNTVVTTGDKSYAVLKFEDGQLATMQANTTVQIKEYHYDSKNAKKSSIIFSKFSGGMRFITGLISQRNHDAFLLTTRNATIGVRGTDFMVSTVNDTLYSQVISGSISMANDAGDALFAAGQAVVVVSPSTLPVAIPATALPKNIFSQLDAIPTPPGIASNTAPSSATEVTEAPLPNDFPLAGIAGAAMQEGTNGLITPPPAIPLPTPDVLSGPDARTISITGGGEHYTGVNLKCDFCTGRSKTVATHTAKPADKAVTGEANLFGKHNLTPTGANTGEICAFCHTPQGSEFNVVPTPKWNRSAPTISSYRAFSSLGSAVAEATGSVSMSCLSCHDGAQAPNIVINTPGNVLNLPDNVEINSIDGLRSHHPVGMPYAGGGENQNAPEIPSDPVAAYKRLAEFNEFTSVDGNKFVFFPRQGIFRKSNDLAARKDVGNFSNAGTYGREDFNKSTYSGSGSGTVWWIETPGSKKGRQKNDLYLFTRTDTIDSIPSESTLSQPYVECATCHDPHSINSTFLRLPGGNARSQICLTCHNK